VRRVSRMVARRISEDGASEAEATCKRLRERLDLGVDHTVVALVGGTGSGKSSLFNALAQMDFAGVGVIRPTTSEATACVWGAGAAALLDWLGIGHEYWIQRDSVLEEHIKALRGLILIDLPDVDSSSPGHRKVVNRVLPLADLLVWVTDPQKYADRRLHDTYLVPLQGQDSSIAVVLNQVDTLDEDAIPKVVDDLAKRLSDDGLKNGVIRPTSALRGDGVTEVRELLIDSTTRRTTGARRASAELRQVASGLIATLGDPRQQPDAVPRADGTLPAWLTAAQDGARRQLAAASGGEKAVSQLLKRREPEAVAVPARDALRLILVSWLEQALQAVPHPWGGAVGHALASPQNLEARLEEALAEVEVPPRPGRLARLLRGASHARRRAHLFESSLIAALDEVIARALTAPTLAVLEDWVSAHATVVKVANRH